jgi:hypothetical protein
MLAQNSLNAAFKRRFPRQLWSRPGEVSKRTALDGRRYRYTIGFGNSLGKRRILVDNFADSGRNWQAGV